MTVTFEVTRNDVVATCHTANFWQKPGEVLETPTIWVQRG